MQLLSETIKNRLWQNSKVLAVEQCARPEPRLQSALLSEINPSNNGKVIGREARLSVPVCCHGHTLAVGAVNQHPV